jgi:hypothetical protein
MKYAKLHEKLHGKLDDIFESTIKIDLGVNEIVALCDLSESVSTFPNILCDRFNLGSFVVTELKLYLTDSAYKKVIGIKDNIGVQIKGCPTLVDLLAVDMLEDPMGHGHYKKSCHGRRS